MSEVKAETFTEGEDLTPVLSESEGKVETVGRGVQAGETRIHIFKSWCKACGICVAFCSAQILARDEGGYPWVRDPGKCIRCGLCEIRCPDFAITVETSNKGRKRGRGKGEEAKEDIADSGQ